MRESRRYTMIKLTVISIKEEDDYLEVAQAIPDFLFDDEVLSCLKKYIGLKCDTVIVEFPYYDKDYLSTYYEHYAKKFKKYEKKCCRLHFENGDDYYGYITLRPTGNGTKIGKTYLDPHLLIEKEAYLMLSNYEVHMHGQSMEIKCFPWKKQETDVSVCAHTAAWTVLRYYGNKYKNYADITIGSIVNKINNTWGRKTPSLGLYPTQISDLFKDYGLSPLILGGEKVDFYQFTDEVIAYIESGLPLVGFLSPEKHAVSFIGHGEINYSMLNDPEKIAEIKDDLVDIIPHSRLIQSLYAMDDRFFPYREVPKLPNKESDVKYGLNQLDHAIVPLYDRMQLNYSEVYARTVAWLQTKELKLEDLNICRLYITSANSLRRNAMASSTMQQELKNVILTLSLPKFVWCVDFAGIENYKSQLTSGRIIIDATSASKDTTAWIMRHDLEKIEYKDYDDNPEYVYTIKTEIRPYRLYENNLQCVRREK